MAVGGDFFYPETTGPRPPMVDALNRYIRKALVASQRDPVVASAVSRVQNMLAPPPSLMRPPVMRRVLGGAGRVPDRSQPAEAFHPTGSAV